MAKKLRRFVPRGIFKAACTASVVPLCVAVACGGTSTTGSSRRAGVAGAGFGGQFSVGVQAFGGAFSVGAGGFGQFSVGAGGFGGQFSVGAAFGGQGGIGMAAGAFGVGSGGFGGRFSVGVGGFGGGNIRDSGTDAPTRIEDGGPDGHASADPETDRAAADASTMGIRRRNARPAPRRRS